MVLEKDMGTTDECGARKLCTGSLVRLPSLLNPKSAISQIILSPVYPTFNGHNLREFVHHLPCVHVSHACN